MAISELRAKQKAPINAGKDLGKWANGGRQAGWQAAGRWAYPCLTQPWPLSAGDGQREWESEAAAVRKYLIVYAIAWAYFKHFVRFAGTFNGQHEERVESGGTWWQGRREREELPPVEAIKAHAK